MSGYHELREEWATIDESREKAMKRVYISGPMTRLPELFNFPAFFAAAEQVRAAGHEPINPAEGVTEFGRPWEWYMRRALRLLLEADEVWMLPGWENSNGARLEQKVAKHLKMPIRYLDREREWKETCDECGKVLDRLKGEDFYDESTNAVYCVDHWPHSQQRRQS